jgi:DNA repair exonuclease SbcCD ATPase subunit
MTIDVNAPEVQDAIKEAVNEAVAGLKNKNTELIAELKKARKDSSIDPDDYSRLKDENEALSEKLSEANKLIKTSSSEFEKLKKAHDSEAGYVSKLIIETGLNDALVKAGVKPELSKAVKALFATQAAIKIDGDNRQAVIGDKSITDFVTEWASSDEGKHFVAAPLNQGGGGHGGGGQGNNAKTMTRDQKIEFSKAGGSITD